MTSMQPDEQFEGDSPEWRNAPMEVEQARQQCARALEARDASEAEVDVIWLRLWRAERRRDELIKL